jgi:hypothetical protein
MTHRIDHVPPDGWVTQVRAIFGIDDDATWSDILVELAQTERLATRAAKEYSAPRTPLSLQVDYTCMCSDHVSSPEYILAVCSLHRDGMPFRIRAVPAWQPMDSMPPDEQVIVCWHDIDSGYDVITRREYRSILSYGEPPALGWMPLPARPAR